MDPTGDNDILPHQFRQSMIISLFGSIVEPPVPADAVYLDVLIDSVCSKISSLINSFTCFFIFGNSVCPFSNFQLA